MHLTKHNPRTYSHRGYTVEALACGAYAYNVWRRSEDLAFCSVQTLQEAAAAIDEDLGAAVPSDAEQLGLLEVGR